MCLSVLFFVSPFFEQVDGCTALISEIIAKQTGTCTGISRGSGLFSGPEPHPARWVVGCGWDELDDVVLQVL